MLFLCICTCAVADLCAHCIFLRVCFITSALCVLDWALCWHVLGNSAPNWTPTEFGYDSWCKWVSLLSSFFLRSVRFPSSVMLHRVLRVFVYADICRIYPARIIMVHLSAQQLQLQLNVCCLNCTLLLFETFSLPRLSSLSRRDIRLSFSEPSYPILQLGSTTGTYVSFSQTSQVRHSIILCLLNEFAWSWTGYLSFQVETRLARYLHGLMSQQVRSSIFWIDSLLCFVVN